MVVEVIVNVQYKENYGSPTSPHWKCKGGSPMLVRLDIKPMDFGSLDVVEDVVKTVCENRSNDMYRYEYLSHEVIFGGLTDVTKEYHEALGVMG